MDLFDLFSSSFSSSKTLPDIGLAKSVQMSWEHELFVDFTIHVEDEEFKVHKLIMASVSDYFKAMLTGGMKESQADTVRLHGFSSLVFSNIIEYIYTNEISKPRAELKELLACAMYLQIPQVIGAATNMLKGLLYAENCFDLACTFEMYALNEALQHTKEYIKSNIDKIEKECEIPNLPYEHFQIFCELWGRSEWDLFVVIKDWVIVDYENRREHWKSLMSHIQFNIMTRTEVEAIRSTDIYRDNSWHELTEAAEEYRKLPTHQKMMQSFRERGDPSPVCFYTDENRAYCVLQKDGNWSEEVESPGIPVFNDGISTSVEFNNFLLVCESYSSNQGWHVFDCRTLEWLTMAKMMTPKTDFALVHDGKESVYALGGRVNVGTHTESVTDCIEKYDVKTNTWSILESTLPAPLQSHCACLCSGAIYVAGGWQTTDKAGPWSRRLECLDLSTNSWQSKKSLLYSVPCHEMYLLESNGEQVIVLMNEWLRLQVYNPKTNQWTVTKYTTSFFKVFAYHPHSKVLACPRENALYLLNYNRSIEEEGEEDYMNLGGCIKLSLMTDERDMEEEMLQGFSLMVGPIWGHALDKNPFIGGVLSLPPTSRKDLFSPRPDEGAKTYGT